MNRRERFEEFVEPCEKDNFKANCALEESESMEIKVSNICNAKCIGILAEKIFDCVYLESLQFADKDEVFAIDGFEDGGNCQYRLGDAVCIDAISLCYDNIGIKDDRSLYEDGNCKNKCLGKGEILVKYDMENKVFSAVSGNGVEVCNYPDKYMDDNRGNKNIPKTVTLYDEFEGTAGKTKCNSETTTKNSKARIFKQGVRFFVDNLKIKIKGRIGTKPFTATKDYNCYGDIYGDCAKISINPVEITKRDTLGNGEGCGEDVGLNFTPINLYGKVSMPNDGRSVKANINLEHCLSIECVETNERYGEYGEGYIRATVGYSFLVTTNIRHTTSEEIAVFVNPNGIECGNVARNTSCKKNTDNNKSESKCQKR